MIYLDWNLGLGDAIICNGLVRELLKRHPAITLPALDRCGASVAHMFSDLPGVKVISQDELWRVRISKPGWADDEHTLNISNTRMGGHAGIFDRQFYEFAGVPFDCRWSSFYAPSRGNAVNVEGRFILESSDTSVGNLTLDYQAPAGSAVVKVAESGTPIITDWIPAIAEAEEIHCVDSAFLHLVESVPTRGKLFFHGYARGGHNISLRKPWTVL